MFIAVAAIILWLFMATIAVSLAAAAKRGDELGQAARQYLPDSATGARIIPFDRALAKRNSELQGLGRTCVASTAIRDSGQAHPESTHMS